MTAAERKAFAASIRPAEKGKSDKYSWRLYQRALKNGRERVYLMAWTSLDDLNVGRVHAYQIALGFRDREWFHGNTLRNICTPGTPTHDWAYGPGHRVAEWIEITDWFWDNYLRVGRCLFWKHEHSWLQINRNARKCAYCGKHVRRTIKTIKKIERREVWV